MAQPASPAASLSSVASVLEDLTRRVTVLAEEATARQDDLLSGELYEVERSLKLFAKKVLPELKQMKTAELVEPSALEMPAHSRAA